MTGTLYEKVWNQHRIVDVPGATLLYIDRHLTHEGSRNAFGLLAERALSVARPKQSFAFADHLIPVRNQPASTEGIVDPNSRVMAGEQITNTRKFGIRLYGLGDADQGIVHVVGPEQGITQPGMTIVCGDSHTSTHGAFGALAFGIGSSEVSHVLATQCLWQRPSKTMEVRFSGRMQHGVTAKDLVLATIARVGANGGAGFVLEYTGEVIRSSSMEERMTICNMSVEAGARAGLIGVDDTTIEFLAGRPYSPTGELWDRAVAHWRTMRSDPDAQFDAMIELDSSTLEPLVTWGISPEDVSPISGAVPDPASYADSGRRQRAETALEYMNLKPGSKLNGLPVDRVFFGSCTNARLSDLSAAARILRGRKVRVPTMVVPGSTVIRRQAESSGLAQVFVDAGCEWLSSGCSMCLGMNGDVGKPGERILSTSNRNFRGRQGPGVRTHLASPFVAAATAVAGALADPREYF